MPIPSLAQRPRLRLALLVALLAGSVAVLFRPIDEPVTRIAKWKTVTAPLGAGRCRAPRPGEARWQVEVAPGFPILAQTLATALGPTCVEGCGVVVQASVQPAWVDRPHFLSGFGRMSVPTVLRREVDGCRDVFEVLLDVSVEEGVRGSAANAQAHTGLLVGAFFADLQSTRRRWPRGRPVPAPVEVETY